MLRFQSSAVRGALLRAENNIGNDKGALKLALRLKSRDACTFTFTGSNKPLSMHMHHCSVCDTDVCVICASVCHTHEGIAEVSDCTV